MADYYKDGAISIENGSTAIVGIDTAWAVLDVARAGDTIFVAGGIILIDEVVSNTEMTAALPWTGANVENAAYALYWSSKQRYSPAVAQVSIREYLNKLAAAAIFYAFAGDSPTTEEAAAPQEGQWALRSTTIPWKLMRYESGVWVEQPGSPGGQGSYILEQPAMPGLSYPINSLWIDSDSADLDVYILDADDGWIDTGVNLKGPKGDAGTIAIGAVATGAAGSAASVTNVGTPSTATLNFSIPQGVQGVPGPQGIQGQGIEFDASGALAERAAHDAEAKGYVFIQTDIAPFALWIKQSASSGDWAGPTYLGSPAAVGDFGSITDAPTETFDYGSIL